MTASARWHIWNAVPSRLVSRRGNVYKSFPALCQALGACLSASEAVLDGEIVYLGPDGKPQFYILCAAEALSISTRSTSCG